MPDGARPPKGVSLPPVGLRASGPQPIVLTASGPGSRITDHIFPPGYVPLTMHNPDLIREK